jgi:hypothetical protein
MVKKLLKGLAVVFVGVTSMGLARNYVTPYIAGVFPVTWPKLRAFVEDAVVFALTLGGAVAATKLTGKFLGHGGPGVSAKVTGGDK